MDAENRAALTATRILAETKSNEFAALVERINYLRESRSGERRSLWVTHCRQWGPYELAGAILYYVIGARLWTETNGGDPLWSTVGANLGTNLIGPGPHEDIDLPMKVGCRLLDVAADEGLIEPVRDFRGGVHVALTPAMFRRLQSLINGAAVEVLRRVRTRPPTGVEVRKPYEMRIPRPEVPARVVEAADKVQGTAWRINRAVLEALRDSELRGALGTEDEPAKLTKGQKLSRALVIAEAHKLATLDRFYFPVFLDFRGRLYQRAGVLTYASGSDYARSLLEFADGEFVDDSGLRWLTWHMTQMWGKDLPRDLPLGDGSAWLREAADVVDRWREAKHPAQFLAAALAVVDAHEGRPVHLPVRVDATCSGLQHLALLGRDTDLAPLVNLWGHYHRGTRRGRVPWLEPEDPQQEDFYQAIASSTEFSRDEVKTVIRALLYGAGLKTNAWDLAEERGAEPSERELEDAQAIRDAAKRLAPRAFELLDWFGAVAKAHNVARLPVRWPTPAGLEVIQDYRLIDESYRPNRQVKIPIQGERVDLVKRFYSRALDRGQQAVSLPSSIVHSLDGALLAELVAGSRIDQWGVVHDAFAVSANRVWELLDEDNPRAMAHVYGPDRLAGWLEEWRAAGADVPDPPTGAKRGPLPPEMLGGLRTLG